MINNQLNKLVRQAHKHRSKVLRESLPTGLDSALKKEFGSIRQAAVVLGIPHSTLAQQLSGRHPLSMETITTLSKHFQNK